MRKKRLPSVWRLPLWEDFRWHYEYCAHIFDSLLLFTQTAAIHTYCCYSHRLLLFTHTAAIHTDCCYSHILLLFTHTASIHTYCCYSHILLLFTHTAAYGVKVRNFTATRASSCFFVSSVNVTRADRHLGLCKSSKIYVQAANQEGANLKGIKDL
jgi:hypothetical protein